MKQVGEYGISDLVTAKVNAARYAKKHPDLARFHLSRYAAFARSFGIEPEAPDSIDTTGLRSLERSAIHAMLRLNSPFSSFLVAPVEVTDLFRRHSRRIGTSLEQSQDAIERLLHDIQVELHGIPADRTVTSRDLQRNGFSPSTPWPDEVDYW